MASALSCASASLQCCETLKFQSIADNAGDTLDNEIRIMNNVFRTEQQYQSMVSSEYMQHQVHITPYMRAILVHWLMEVGHEYMLKRSTVNLAINFLDRILTQTRDVKVSQLQLLGVSCLHTAAKLEEIYPPKISDFALTTDGACNVEGIKKMEMVIAKHLQWRFTPPVPHFWANTFASFLRHRNTPNEPLEEVSDLVEAAQNAGSLGETALADAVPAGKGRLTPPKVSKRDQLPRPEMLVEQTMDVVDACSIDVRSCAFPPSLITQMAMVHVLSKHKNPSLYAPLTKLLEVRTSASMMRACCDMVRIFANEIVEQQCPSKKPVAKKTRVVAKKRPQFYNVVQSHQSGLVARWKEYQARASETHAEEELGAAPS